ncbi:MAG: hypothetical protein R3C05_29030 [Pirellulaceae bacterium]
MFCAFALSTTSLTLADDAIPESPTQRWWKGNLHTHSLWSDGDDFPEMIAEWYRNHGYHFLVLSDHNLLSEGQRWMKHNDIVKRGGGDALAKYRARFGGSWVQTRGDGDAMEVRLKPLDEFRYLVEERGRFIMIPSEEISDRASGKPVHMNATNIGEAIEPLGGETPAEAMTNNLRAVREQAERLGREIIVHLNHPNFGWAITAEELASVIEEQFFEVYNGHPGVNHLGDETRPSVERIWDIANAMRLSVLQATPLLGLATDDSHDYHNKGNSKGSNTGRGWVMVRSEYLTPEHLIDACRRADFYASSGVSLKSVSFDEKSKTLEIEIAAEPGESFTTTFIGTKIGDDKLAMPASDQVGVTLSEQEGHSVRYTMQDDDLYVRATITSSQAVDDPSFAGQRKQAWTQPVGYPLFDQTDGTSKAEPSTNP